MSKEEKSNEDNGINYDSLQAMYYSGKVKPSLNKILAALETEPDHLEANILACKGLLRSKDYEALEKQADKLIKIEPNRAEGFYYKGLALQYVKGREQEALKNFNEALKIDPNDVESLKSKASTHLLLFKDFDLPIKLADKHRIKAEESLLKIVELLEDKEGASYKELYILAEVNMLMSKALNAKMYYFKAVNAYEATDKAEQDKNIYKDMIKAQKACIKTLEKFTE